MVLIKYPFCGFIISCLIASTAYAQERIPDLSMSPEESLQQPDVVHPHSDIAQPYNPPYDSSPLQGRVAAAPEDRSGHFVDGYCDPNFKPLASGAMVDCMERQRQQSCATFHSLPADAKHAISRAADCLYAASEGGDENKASDCSESDSARLSLLRQYHGDDAVSRALTSLPEEMVNVSGNCTGGGR